MQDKEGSIWVGTYNGLNLIENPSNDNVVFKRYFFNDKQPEKGPINNVIMYLKEVSGNLYIGTLSGVCRYNFLNDKFYALNIANHKYWVRSIEADENQNLWISTTEGILNYKIEQNNFKFFNKKDGLNNTSYRLGCSFKDKNNTIYFAYPDGLTSFLPKNLLSNIVKPPVYITEIEINNRNNKTQYANGVHIDKIELNHNDYRLSIDYSALNYNRPDKNQYIYRLVGMETQWNEIKFGTPIVFTHLEPKEYLLEVMACNNDGI